MFTKEAYDSNVEKSVDCHETWNSCKQKYPEEGRNVLLWRHKIKGYTVACIENSDDEGRWGSPKGITMKWRSHRSNALKLDDKDFWRYFPYLRITEEYL